jgi:hypothetical protein
MLWRYVEWVIKRVGGFVGIESVFYGMDVLGCLVIGRIAWDFQKTIH